METVFVAMGIGGWVIGVFTTREDAEKACKTEGQLVRVEGRIVNPSWETWHDRVEAAREADYQATIAREKVR